MLTEQDMTEKVLKQLITEKKQELENEIENNPEIKKLNTDIMALEITLKTLTKNDKIPQETTEPQPHPLDRECVNKKIELFNKQGTGYTIKKDYKNCNLSLWGEKGNLISFSQYNRNIDNSAIEELDTWLDKTVKYSGYYNKLKKIFKKTNKDFFISSVFDKQGDRIYIQYSHQSKNMNVTSVFHIKKRGKSYIESTKVVNDCIEQFELKLKNNTTLNISPLPTSSCENNQMRITLKHIEKNVNPNKLNTHFEKIFKAFDKQNHI